MEQETVVRCRPRTHALLALLSVVLLPLLVHCGSPDPHNHHQQHHQQQRAEEPCTGLNIVASYTTENAQVTNADVVICGAVQPMFEPGFTSSYGSTPFVPRGVQDLNVTWWYSLDPAVAASLNSTNSSSLESEEPGIDIVHYSVTHSLGISGTSSSTSTSAKSLTGTELDFGLDDSGTISTHPNSFLMVLNCSYTFTAFVDLFVFLSATEVLSGVEIPDGAISPFLSTIRWDCAAPGCDEYCPEHGVCDYLLGECNCNGLWVGPYCAVQVETRDSLCPDESIELTYYIPCNRAYIQGVLAINSMWFSLYVIDPYLGLDWRYLVNWSTYLPLETDPGFGMNNTGVNVTLPDVLYPGTTYRFELFSDDVGTYTLYSTQIEIKDWSDCGYENIKCGLLNSTNYCNSDLGWGTCDPSTNTCTCVTGRFWYDCSRGCSPYAEVFQSSGVVTSDQTAPGQSNMRSYIDSLKCYWVISPSGKFDAIDLSFSLFGLDLCDSLSIYSLPTSEDYNSTLLPPTDPVHLVTSLSGLELPSALTVEAQRLILVLSTDYITPGIGFVAEYTTRSLPMPAGKKALIIALSIVGAMLITISAVISVVFLVRMKQRREEEALNTPADLRPYSEFTELKFVEEESLHLLKQNHLEINKCFLDFGAAGKTIPVQEWKQEGIELTNTSNRRKEYIFRIPDITDIIEFDIKPGRGVIDPGVVMVVVVNVRLMCTTKYEVPLRLDILEGEKQKEKKSILIGIHLAGEMSFRLDPADIALEPVPIASGAFGSVFKGLYRAQIVAVKVLKTQADIRRKEFQDFCNECDVMKALRHPNIVSFVGASFVTGHLCIVTEFMPNGNLADYLVSKLIIPFALLLKFALNTAEALSYLHQNNYIYRDVKCSNILVVSTSLDSEVNCKLADFGTARHVDDIHDLRTYTNRAGTLVYMAPEYFTTKMYNTKVDVYSYGMCLWQMWVREEPWSSAVVWDIPNIVSTGARPEVPRDCPIKYSQLMQQCWAQQQDVRPEFDDIIQIISDLLQAEQSYILTSRSESRHSNRTNTPTKHSSTPPQTRSSTNSKNSNTRSIPKHDSDKPVTAVSLTTITTTTSTTPTPPLGSGVGTPRVPLSVHTDSRTSDSAKKLVRQNSKSLGSYLKHSKADGSRFRKLAVALDSSSTVANPSSLHHP